MAEQDIIAQVQQDQVMDVDVEAAAVPYKIDNTEFKGDRIRAAKWFAELYKQKERNPFPTRIDGHHGEMYFFEGIGEPKDDHLKIRDATGEHWFGNTKGRENEGEAMHY